MRKVEIMWGEKPISEQELIKKVNANFWIPKVFSTFPPEERQAYLRLRWWDSKIQPHLPDAAKDFYRRVSEARARERFGGVPFIDQLRNIKDPVEKLEAVNDALILLMAEMNDVSQLRRETLLLADFDGIPTRELADVLHVSLPRVRQIVLDARRKAGLPIEPQHGGHNHDKPASDSE